MDAQKAYNHVHIGKRGSAAPLAWDKSVSLGYHHVIPFTVLRDTFNRLLERHIALDVPEARTALRQFLSLCDRDIPELDSKIDRIRSGLRPQSGPHHPPPLKTFEADELRAAVVWPSWNAVQGPQQREDDPENVLDRFRVGLTPDELARIRLVESLHLHLQEFLGASLKPPVECLRALSQQLVFHRPLLAGQGPIPYRPDMWVKQPSGKWRKRREGESLSAVQGR